MKTKKIAILTQGPGLYPVTDKIQETLKDTINSGIVFIFCPHTSCSLLISESYDPTAKKDLENFFNYLAPNNLPFIEHTLEGEDDSPAHMKSSLLNQTLSLIVEDSNLILGTWQGIYLAEFRNQPKQRMLYIKTLCD